MRNTKMLLILFMAIVLISVPVLSVDASIKGSNDKLQIDLSNGVIQNGYFSLPIDKSSDELIFDLAYIAGYYDKTNDTFVSMATRVANHSEWLTEKKLNIPLDIKLITLNNIIVRSIRDQYRLNSYNIPLMLNGKEITLFMTMDGDSSIIDFAMDEQGNEITLKNGDVLLPVFRVYKGNKTEDLVQEDKKIIYNGKLTMSTVSADSSKLAFRIYAQSTHAGGHAESGVIVPSEYRSVGNSNSSSPSQWAKAEIAKAIESGLATERVQKDYQKAITREEFCELVVNMYEKMSGKTAEPVSPNPFIDTDNLAVLKAYKLGIVNGTGPDEFSPDKLLNREQMAKMFYNAILLANPNVGAATEELSFSDKNKISGWAIQPIKFMFKEKIILGSNNMFNPQQEASKEQALVLVLRVYERFKK